MLKDFEIRKSQLVKVAVVRHTTPHVDPTPQEEPCSGMGIHFVEEGAFELGVGGRAWLLKGDEIFLSQTGVVHRYTHLRDVPPDVCLSVRFKPTLLKLLRTELGYFAFDRLAPVIRRDNRINYLRWRLDHAVQTDSQLALDEWAVELLYGVANASELPLDNVFRKHQLTWYAERIDAARQLLEQTYPEDHALHWLARSVGMSTFQFARIFRQLMGTPPHQYLLRVRFAQASRMLREGSSVTDACYDAGFSNLSHFTRRFKAHFGYLPSALKPCRSAQFSGEAR